MKHLLLAITLTLPQASGAASSGHAACLQLVSNVYEGWALTKGNEREMNAYFFEQIRAGALTSDEKTQVYKDIAKFEEAAAKLADSLSQACESIRANSP